jgi:hypothetical protein
VRSHRECYLQSKRSGITWPFACRRLIGAAVDLPLLASIQEQQENRGYTGTAIDHLVHSAAVRRHADTIILGILPDDGVDAGGDSPGGEPKAGVQIFREFEA